MLKISLMSLTYLIPSLVRYYRWAPGTCGTVGGRSNYEHQCPTKTYILLHLMISNLTGRFLIVQRIWWSALPHSLPVSLGRPMRLWNFHANMMLRGFFFCLLSNLEVRGSGFVIENVWRNFSETECKVGVDCIYKSMLNATHAYVGSDEYERKVNLFEQLYQFTSEINRQAHGSCNGLRIFG